MNFVSVSKVPLKERFLHWRQLHPRRFKLLIAGMVALTLGVVLLIFINFFTFKKQVTYDPCTIEYGTTVAEWDGLGNDEWNNQGFHYQTKQFLVKSRAPRQIFPNVAESPVNTLATSTLDGSEGCQNDFTGLVDTNVANYQWYGAKPSAARLGLPSKADNYDGKVSIETKRTRLSKDLSPPVFGSSHSRAAAWVDDGAQAVLQSADRVRTQLLWCQGYAQPLDATGSCNDLTDPPEGQLFKRGAGYMFTSDNCPLSNCEGVDSWYNKDGAQKDLNYTSLIGTNERGELNPFFLHLSSASTYASTMGTWMTMTFAYPAKPEITSEISTSPKNVAAGASFDVSVKLSQIGPNLKNINMAARLEEQPIKENSGFIISTENLEAINRGESALVTAKFTLTGGSPGECFDLPISISAVVDAPNPDPKKKTEEYRVDVSPAPSARYCVQVPVTQTVYTYEVNSRGGIASDLNEFASLAAETLGSVLGWGQAGISFQRVASGGNFTLVLSSPDQMTTFSSGCDSTYSCNVGRYVVINDERWRTATPSWNGAGGSLRDYRHMVVNHETGHWLGFGHMQCPAVGAPAPVMQQQSISLQGCAFNPWPTPVEVQTLKARLQG